MSSIAGPGQPIDILIAEDSPTQAQRLQHILVKEGYRVTHAANGREALEAARQRTPALVISDVIMPEMDGYELCRRIKDNPALADVPVILVTTLSDPGDVIRGLECRADNFIIKPYDEHYLVGRVQFVLVNRDIRQTEQSGLAVQIFFNGQRHTITADRLQILNLLLSTYDAAIQRNKDLTSAQAALIEIEERTRLIISTAHDAFVGMDDQGSIIEWNLAAEKTFGWSRDEVIGRSLTMTIVPPAYRESHEGSLAHLLRTGEGAILNTRLELTALHRAGHEFPIELLVWAIHTAGKRSFNAFIRDITEQKRAETAVRMAREEAERANQAKSNFLASMSHELRTPLNSILGFAELLQDPAFGRLDDQQRKFVANIHGSGTHLLGLVNDVLDLSKVAAGKMELHLEPVNVAAVVQGIADIVRPLADRKKLTFTVDPVDRHLQVLADAARVKQILYNLISNAIKFTPEGGDIAVRAMALPDALRFSVEDDGIGIAEGDQERIFQEFQQVDSALSRQFDGTGLGLALTQKFVRLHGGDISVTSSPGMGSTFTFTLPRCADTEAGPDAGPADVAHQARPTILVIEDDPHARDLITTHLTREGYHVLHATDGAEGVRKARVHRPIAIVLDILLPLKNGWDVLAELKASPATIGIPVVIVSIADDEMRGFSLGAAAYLTKPVSRSRLLGAVKNLSLTTKVRNRRVQLLIVDDDPQALELVAATFEPYGFQLLTATSGREAVRLIAETHPDLVILDLMMPDLNGFDVIDAMKADPATADIPVFILSAKDLSQEERVRLNGQVTARLDKRGFSPEHMLIELRRLRRWLPLNTPPLIDNVTALFNEVYFDKRLREEVARGQRYGRQFTVALMAIDAFDDLAAAQGHVGTDLLLERFSRLLERTLRTADPVARLGGGVFAVLLPETIGDRAVTAMEKLQTMLRNETFPMDGGEPPVRLTLNIGIACYPADGEKADELEQAARSALERAKALRHNKVVTAWPRTTEGGPAA